MSDSLFKYGLSFLLLKICKDKEDIKCLIWKKNLFDYIKKDHNKMDYTSTHTCEIIGEIGDLPLLKYAHENGCKWDEYTIGCAAEYGHLDCIKYAHENGCKWHENTTSIAARFGHLDILKYANENGCSWNQTTAYFAAINQKMDCLQYAHEVHMAFAQGLRKPPL